MGFSETLQWWQEWQLRILALSSLLFQYFLFMTSLLRKRCISSWVRFFIWLAYLGSDAIALYALAALFNFPRDVSLGVKVLWAPILLVHLGGQDCITAYNIEDNELWKRHVLTAVSQVTVAVYVFWKSWSLDKNGYYLAAAILLFFPGILKCILKPWDLKRVSMNSLVSSSGSKDKDRIWINALESGSNEAEDFVTLAQESTNDGTSDGGNELPLFQRPYDLFVDLAPLNSDRLSCMKHFKDNINSVNVHSQIRSSLSVTFDRLYTKESVLHQNLRSIFIDLLRILATCCILAVLVLVHITQEEAMDTDVRITYILLACTAGLEYLIPALVFNRFNQQFGQQQWPDQVYQYNLLWYLAQNKKRRRFRKLATLLVCKEYLDQHWCLPSCNSSGNITNLVHAYLKEGWSGKMDMATYRAFNDNRGQRTLKLVMNCGLNLKRSLGRPFDESVILWHLATDFCFHLTEQLNATTVLHSREMSNYMVYLLFVNPEMLMTGARRGLFRTAYRQLKKTLKIQPNDRGPSPQADTPQAQTDLALKIVHNIRHATRCQDLSIVNGAWDLAQELMKLRSGDDDEPMWKVIQGVWVEMLCFSAGRCRGYLHAKSLGNGGEYLSYVWLLLLYIGMETLGEKMQRTNLVDEETNNDGSAIDGGTNNVTTADTPVLQATGGCHGDAATEDSQVMATGGDGDAITPPLRQSVAGSIVQGPS